MTDANGEESDGIKLTITKVKNKQLTVKLTADSVWLDAQERAYPVTLDPYVEVKQKRNRRYWQHPCHRRFTYYYRSGRYLYVGRSSNTSWGDSRSYLQFTPPPLETGAVVVNATLTIGQFTGDFGTTSPGLCKCL